MVDSIGKKLQTIRLEKNISLMDVAHYTKIPVHHLSDLENDNFGNFPSLVYVRGFLTIYARYLGMDISSYLDQFEADNAISLEGYQYLNGDAPVTEHSQRRFADERKNVRPSLPWLLIFTTIVLVGAGWLFLSENLKRLEGYDPNSKSAVHESTETSEPSPQKETLALSENPALGQSADPTPQITPELVTASNPEPVSPSVSETIEIVETPSASPTPIPSAEESEIPVARAVPVEAEDSESSEKILEIRPIGNTKIRIVKNSADNPPSFEGSVTAEDEPLIFKGHRFWINVENPAAVEIFRNGQPLQINEVKID